MDQIIIVFGMIQNYCLRDDTEIFLMMEATDRSCSKNHE